MDPDKQRLLIPDENLVQVMEENEHNERHLEVCSLGEMSDIRPLEEPISKHEDYHTKPEMVDVGVQCDSVNVLEEICFHITKRFPTLNSGFDTWCSWLKRVSQWIVKTISYWKPSKPCACKCDKRLTDLEEKMNALEVKDLTNIQIILDYEANIKTLTEEIKYLKQFNARSVGPACVMSTPTGFAPPPPPPPPPPMMLLNQSLAIPKIKKTKPAEKENISSRPVITAEALLSVKLNKVTDRTPVTLTSNQGGGPLVTLEQLRSVKLRTRRKHHIVSPTKTPLCRDPVFKASRSPSCRRERRPRLDRMPLSTILNMDLE